ncbi:DUF2510 domain-containing protein [Curtobacterium flaccumfaciens pv. oortii]|uniref:DUF2510 domain-containing protein n=1 Tax=Curtobacterium flaccumfaciens TaxID=2035 RepID=UPI00265905D6|nr:DUF2510 domain-containing protein [Curtobacterium flaccumfaciens]MCS5521201.1 DUF2510 domain-containing protein [Curtobacterium flaccumfaciens pv. oortii]
MIAAIVVAVVILAGGGTAAAFVSHARQVQAAEAKAERGRAAEQRTQAQQRAEEAQKAADDTERTARADTVTGVEASVKKLAEDDAAKGVIDGPILSVSCNPVSGSTDDLTDTTTTFDCFAANTNNADGTQSGYFFNATVNWDSGEYTYGLGKSGA